jgi:hypothetical protein
VRDDSSPSDAQLVAQTLAAAPSVQSVRVEASVGNWDGDPEPDGLVVRVFPLDANGVITPVSATAVVTLTGVSGRRRPSPESSMRAVDDQFPRLGRWSETVRPSDYGVYGATFRLPFQAVDPGFDRHQRGYGLVHVRLTVPGQGVFEASSEPTTIRPLSVVRDRHESVHGTRRLPTESAGRSRTSK